LLCLWELKLWFRKFNNWLNVLIHYL